MDRSQPCDLDAIKRLAREQALKLGAAAVRVADAADDVDAREAMRLSFARGDLLTWPYDEQYARTATSPQALLPEAKAVICIALPYATPARSPGPLEGRVSNYAWSSDYHRRMQALLRSVAERIDDAAGASVTTVACDTKPLAERAIAARAGLGWIGKHTNLIAPQAGSFVFLGEIITTLPLRADPPLRKTCGACTRCVPACPTGALRGDYTIEATRCISDLTQRTDPIPRAMRPLIGLWVWGCDLCQTACPPNARATIGGSSESAPLSPALATPSLVALLRLRSGDYRRTYRNSAMGWRGAAVLRRNAAVALGNSLDRAAVPSLVQALRDDPHPMVRGHAAWALGRIGSPPALSALAQTLERETDPRVRDEIALARETFGTQEPLQPV